MVAGSSFIWLLCPFDMPPSMCGFFFFFGHFLTFWHYKILQAYLVYFLLLSLKQPFLQGTLIPFNRACSSSGQKLDWCCHLWLLMAKVTSVLHFSLLCCVILHLLPLKRLLLAELCPLKFMCWSPNPAPYNGLKIIQQIFNRFPLPLGAEYIFLPHWLWAWPSDLFWPTENEQTWCGMSRSFQHACTVGFGLSFTCHLS